MQLHIVVMYVQVLLHIMTSFMHALITVGNSSAGAYLYLWFDSNIYVRTYVYM